MGTSKAARVGCKAGARGQDKVPRGGRTSTGANAPFIPGRTDEAIALVRVKPHEQGAQDGLATAAPLCVDTTSHLQPRKAGATSGRNQAREEAASAVYGLARLKGLQAR